MKHSIVIKAIAILIVLGMSTHTASSRAVSLAVTETQNLIGAGEEQLLEFSAFEDVTPEPTDLVSYTLSWSNVSYSLLVYEALDWNADIGYSLSGESTTISTTGTGDYFSHVDIQFADGEVVLGPDFFEETPSMGWFVSGIGGSNQYDDNGWSGEVTLQYNYEGVGLPSLLDEDLNNQIIYAGAAVVGGASSIVDGNVEAVAAAGFGADAEVDGNIVAGAAVTMGAGSSTTGKITAGAAVTLGADASVDGAAYAGTSVTIGLNASATNYDEYNKTEIIAAQIKDGKAKLSDLQNRLASAEAPPENQSLDAYTGNVDVVPGVYHLTVLTTAAGTTLTFNGNGEDNVWLINVDTYAAFGADTTFDLVDVTGNSSIIINAGGYVTSGANANLAGTIFAGSYILTGAGTTLSGAAGTCGLFAVNGGVSIGADNKIGEFDACSGGALPSNLSIDI
jgi:hypothetical protein